MTPETAEFVELIKDWSPVELRVLGALLTLLELPHGDVDMSTPLAGQRYLRTLLVIMQNDMFRGDQWQAERNVIAKHIVNADRTIADMEGTQP